MLEIPQHFCSVFPDIWSKIKANVKELLLDKTGDRASRCL